MSANLPPDPYFNNINFNPSFFSTVVQYLTETIANLKYLRLIGGRLTGNLGIKITPRAELDVAGSAIINTGLNGPPTNGIIGSTGTRLILTEGNAGATPYGIGNDLNAQWYGVPAAASHVFYTGTNERMRITNAGTVGIGTNNPANLLHLHSPLTSQNISLKLTDATSGAGSTDGISILKTNLNDLFINVHENARMYFFTNNTIRMNILANGNVAIGSLTPDTIPNIFQVGGDGSRLRISNGANDYTSIGVKDVDDANNTRIVLSGHTRSINPGNIEYNAVQNHIFNTTLGAGYFQRVQISSNGNVGIGPNTPANIFQVGDGGRLRISNGQNDFTLIGTKEVDDANNTKIRISGNTRSGTQGDIDYIATTTVGTHIFYTESTNQLLYIDKNEIYSSKKFTVFNGNYYTSGEFITYSSKTDSGGTFRVGYFITNEFFFNSMINIAVSHTTPNYTFWHGHYGTNNTTATMYINVLNSVNMAFETFVEQTTLKSWIRVYPTIAFDTSVQLRVKFYG